MSSEFSIELVPTSTGRAVPLTQVARVTLQSEPGVIWRENRDYGITVQSDVVDGVQGPTVTAQINPLLDKIRTDLPPDYQIKIAGAEEESANAGASIAAQMPLCIFIIFLLLPAFSCPFASVYKMNRSCLQCHGRASLFCSLVAVGRFVDFPFRMFALM